MDYKKKYNDALERARNELKQDLHESGIWAINRIFPELAESEDEKIRKFLVKHVSEWIGCIEHDLKFSSKDVESEEELAMFKAGLAYLEKQKDSIPYAKYVEDIAAINAEARTKYHAGWNDGYEAKQKETPMPDSTKLIELWDKEQAMLQEKDFRGNEWLLAQIAFMDGVCYGYGIKQKEQKQECLADSSKTSADDDEKIRKAIMVYIDWLDGKKDCQPKGAYSIRDMLDWLERQKEQKPVQNPKKGCPTYPLSVVGDLLAKTPQEPIRFGQKQKPAGWSKNDTAFLNEITDFFENKTVKLQHDLDMYAHWLKSLPERFNLQPKQEWSEKHIADIFEKVGLAKIAREQGNDELTNALQDAMLELSKVENTEWSEEDEDKLYQIIETLLADKEVARQENPRHYDALSKAYDELIAWLKSLPLNLKKKNEDVAKLCSNEWSEEDERMLTGIIKRGSSQVPFGEPALREEQMEWLMNWLKFLRPQSKDEIYKEKDEAYKLGKHHLATKFMKYLDKNIPEGKMSLSNGECEDIDKAFIENDWAKIMRYVEKYCQKRTKEWCDEDEKKLNHILEIVHIASGREASVDEKEELESFLKSLRPSWKPSEEQVKALNAVNCYGGISYVGQQNDLISLYNDLKKLM